MQFDAETGLGRVWVTLVRDGVYSMEQVPKLGDLQEVVKCALKREETR